MLLYRCLFSLPMITAAASLKTFLPFACLISKAFVMAVFCALFLCVSVLFKNKLWGTIVFTFLFGMMLYPAASVATLSSTVTTVIITLIVGVVGFIALGLLFLKHRDLL